MQSLWSSPSHKEVRHLKTNCSSSLNKSEANYSQIEKLANSFFGAYNKFSEFYYERKFRLITDHKLFPFNTLNFFKVSITKSHADEQKNMQMLRHYYWISKQYHRLLLTQLHIVLAVTRTKITEKTKTDRIYFPSSQKFSMTSMIVSKAISILRSLFAHYGLPVILVSHNGIFWSVMLFSLSTQHHIIWKSMASFKDIYRRWFGFKHFRYTTQLPECRLPNFFSKRSSYKKLSTQTQWQFTWTSNKKNFSWSVSSGSEL